MSAQELKRLQQGLKDFAEEMKRANIHVGLGKPCVCTTCGKPWPCPGTEPPPSTTAGLLR